MEDTFITAQQFLMSGSITMLFVFLWVSLTRVCDEMTRERRRNTHMNRWQEYPREVPQNFQYILVNMENSEISLEHRMYIYDPQPKGKQAILRNGEDVYQVDEFKWLPVPDLEQEAKYDIS